MSAEPRGKECDERVVHNKDVAGVEGLRNRLHGGIARSAASKHDDADPSRRWKVDEWSASIR